MKRSIFFFEKKAWDMGLKFIAGCDEVGRGSFAGPVVAGCVVFNREVVEKYEKDRVKCLGRLKQVIINDSKILSQLQRERANYWIMSNAVSYGIGKGSVKLINKKGIVKAANFAFRSAVKAAQNNMNARIQYLFIDGFYVPYMRCYRIPLKNNRKFIKLSKGLVNQLAIPKGDAKSFSIAAASIVAKVYRDNLMRDLAGKKKYICYGWESNKGYGTKMHRDAIKSYGTTKLHREKFVRFCFSIRNK